MTFPIDALAQDALTPGSLAFGVLVGVGFGFVLERSGFGRAQKLVAQFYGTDMTVFKVMFSAIVTAMLGVAILSAAGQLDLAAVTAEYPTYLWPMLVGGLALGVGFIVSGYCPGTSVVAAASGKLDGMVTVAGVILGSLVYAELQPRFAAFHVSGDLHGLFLYDLLHLPALVLAVLITAMAVGMFLGAQKIEKLVNARIAARSAQP
jgi:uncharacterized protein